MKNKCGYNKKELQLIRDFIKEINEEIVLRISPNGEFCCDLPGYRLFLGKKKPSLMDILWETWYKQQEFYCGDVNKKMITLLHEIGHFETFDVNEWTTRNKKVRFLENQYYQDKLSFEDLNYAYWDLDNEYKATKWAIDYYTHNREKCDRLAAMLNFRYYRKKIV